MDRLEKLVERYLKELQFEGRSGYTVKNYKKHLDKFLKWASQNNIDFIQINGRESKAFRNSLQELNLSPKTINTIIGACKSFYDYLIEEEIIQGHSWITKRLRVKEELRKPDFLSDEELKVIEEEIERLPYNPKWVFKTMLATGLRVSEAVNLTSLDVVIQNGAQFVRVRMGKGKKERYSPVMDEETAKELIRLSKEKKGKFFGITVATAKLYAWKIKQKTGINFHSHRLRHTVATRLLAQGYPIDVVQKVLEHSDISTTRKYAETLPEAIQKLAVKVE